MIAFAVKVKGIDDTTDRARWVVAVDPMGERFLVVHEDKTFGWHPIDECMFVQMVDPKAPQPVVIAPPRGGLTIAGPSLPRPEN